MDTLEADFLSGALHPGDLKPGLVIQLNAILAPVREHFSTDKHAMDLLKRVKTYKTTR
jgi:tyrosyl-tRNA synthetase